MKRTSMMIGFALMVASLPAAGYAQVRQDFKKMPISGSYAEFEAGEICDFRQSIESLGGSIIRIRFYDADGNKLRAVLIGDETIRHTNLETGYAIVEELHGALHRDFVTGEETRTGLFWHDRSPDGKLVLAGAGRYVVDLETGEVVAWTPNALLEDGAYCAALGGALAHP